MIRQLPFVLLMSLASAMPLACSASPDSDDQSEDALSTTLSATTMKSATAYKSFSTAGGGFGQSGRSMKFLIDLRDPKAKQIYFVNGNFKLGGKVPEYAKLHYLFAQKQLGITESNSEFNDSTYFTDKKRYIAGTIQTYTIGDSKDPIYAIQFYPDDVIHEQGILDAVSTVKAAFAIPSAKMYFVATGAQQTTGTVATKIAALGLQISSVEHLLGSVNYLPLNAGEAWGYLRVFPKDLGDLRPSDIPVFDELPLDLSVVSGTITKVFQDVTSHVNLKSKERGTPNMVLRDAATNALITSLKDKPVHLTVGKDGFKLVASTKSVVDAKLAEHTNKPWIPFSIVDESKVIDYDSMCTASSPKDCLAAGQRFGGKASGLGFLANRNVVGRVATTGTVSNKIGYDLVPRGFGIPLKYYRDFVSSTVNSTLKTSLDSLVTKEKAGTLAPNERTALATAAQKLFYAGTIPAADLTAIQAQITALKAAVPGINKIKVRSSANAEDIPNFDGAGLHDSFSAKLDAVDNPDGSCVIESDDSDVVTKLKVKPQTVQCAVKAVYGSLWNPRAIEERSFARIDHSTAAMGIAVVPAYDTDSDIASNGVIITRAVNGDDLLGYTLSLQDGDNLVTNPTPGTISQMTMAIFGGIDRATHFTIARYATPKVGAAPLTVSVMSEADMAKVIDVSKAVEIAYCKANPEYYVGGDCRYVWVDNMKEHALDLEFKFLENNHIALKQVREFNGQ